MNGEERIDAALSGKPCDKVPVMLHHFMHAAAESGVFMRQFRDDPVLAAHALANSTGKCGLGAVFVYVDTALLAGACGVPVVFPGYEPAPCKGRLLNTPKQIEELPRPSVFAGEARLSSIRAAPFLPKHLNRTSRRCCTLLSAKAL